ncbi:MAG: hypothetical protein IKN71_02420 [Alphaproteobacteria bacterium]|nr:hypothetical protein [Alphaproteobacteria bacterium]
MNWIKRVFWACKIRFGTLEAKDLEHLCAIYDTFQDPKEKSAWISLHAWKKLTCKECKNFLELYLKHHTADEGLLKIDWIMKNEHIRHAYLHSLCSRDIPLTPAEEDWILDCGESGALRCLRHQLSPDSELELLLSEQFPAMDSYVVGHQLSPSGEALLAKRAADCNYPERAVSYRKILEQYFRAQQEFHNRKVFTSFEALWELFGSEDNEQFIWKIIDRCNIGAQTLENSIIRRMAWGMSPKYLEGYLVQSYIADKDLIAELFRQGLSEKLQNLIVLSSMRRSIHQLLGYSLYGDIDDWHDDERNVYVAFDREANAKKRMADLLEFVRPRLANGEVSPAMAVWVAERCPELAQEAMLNMVLFEKKIRGLADSPYLLYHQLGNAFPY